MYLPCTVNEILSLVSQNLLPRTTSFTTFCIDFHIFVMARDRDFKFGRDVDSSKCNCKVMGGKPLPKGTWSGKVKVNHLFFWENQPYLWNGWSYRVVKFCIDVSYVKFQCMDDTSPLKRGVVRVTWPIITAQRFASMVYAVVVCLSVCVCLSQAGTVSKWLTAGLRKQRYTIAQGR